MAWAPNYCTSSDLKTFMRISGTTDDAVIAMAISAASRAVDRECDRQFGSTDTAEARYYELQWDDYKNNWYIQPDDIATLSDLTIGVDIADDETFSESVTNYSVRPRNALTKGEPVTSIVLKDFSDNFGCVENPEVEVHATFGWVAVPDSVKYATMLQASRLVSRRDAPFGISGSVEAGGELRILDKLDADLVVIVRPYKRKWSMV